jgi:hypothetical protein
MWYVEDLVKTMPRRKCPWGATKEIGLFTTPSYLSNGSGVNVARGELCDAEISNYIVLF